MAKVVLVCGGRDYKDSKHVDEVLSGMLAHYGELIIVHGNAGGADSEAAYWAQLNDQHKVGMPAIWRRHNRAAGPIRNSMMLKLRPDICVAFPGGAGTADMVKKARTAGVETYEV